MQNRNAMPFFWPKLALHGLFIGALATGCAAGGGTVEGQSGDELGTDPGSSAPPSAPTLNNPAPAPVATNTTGASTPSTTSPVTSVPASDTESEVLPEPQREEDAQQPADSGDDEPGDDDPPANPGDDDDDDDNGGDDDDDDDDNGGGDDDDDDDSGGDDDDDDDDSGGDDDDDGDDDGGGTGVTPPPDPGNPPPNGDAVTFTADIRPILVTNCGRCHASGGLPQFASANAATGYDVAFSERNSIVSEIRSGSMPADTCNGSPGSNGCVSTADFALIQQWVAAGAPE